MSCMSLNIGAASGLKFVSNWQNHLVKLFSPKEQGCSNFSSSNSGCFNLRVRRSSCRGFDTYKSFTVFNSLEVDNGNPKERVVVLVIGGGGREHALCHALRRSPSCDAIFCAPGNAGISSSGDATCISDLDVLDGAAVIAFCRKWRVGLVVVGPEAPLVAGLANDLVKEGIPTFGPSSEAAALEGSKNFMKSLCDKYGIPTAKYQAFTDPSAAKEYIKQEGAPIVVKADGLAAGKGVIVAMTLEQAYEAVDSMLVDNVFGSAGSRVVVEEYLEGEEASFFALVDGEHAIPLESAQDHKRVGDGDTGPNTGGMGAYSPAPVLTEELQSVVMESIILPTVKGMAEEGCKFVGVLYAGLMIEKKSGLPKLIEYNVRFGDPECQVLMVRLESDLVEILLAACRGKLHGMSLDWSPGSAMVVVMASNGYPGSYQKGTIISKLEEAEQVAPSVKVFHAGTAFDADGNFIATGGRVLGVTAKGKDLEEARDRAYQVVEQINWPGGFYRRDIGWRALPQKQYSVKRKELDDVLGTTSGISSGIGGSLLSSAKGKRSERDREGKGSGREALSRNGTTKIGRLASSNVKGERKPKTKAKQKTAQLSTSVGLFSEPKLPGSSTAKSNGTSATGTGNDKTECNLEELEDPIDLSGLQLPGMDVLGDPDDLGGQGQDIGSWLNIDDDGLQDHDFLGLEIPMNDLSDLNMMV